MQRVIRSIGAFKHSRETGFDMATVTSRSNAGPFALSAILAFTMATVALAQTADSANGTVTINTEFPGGNATVLANEPGVVNVAPDLRGDRPWFYWYFEAVAAKPGHVTFVFPEKVAGFTNGAIGFQGPAISTDSGKTWKWMGVDRVKDNSFSYEFRRSEERVRFAVTIL